MFACQAHALAFATLIFYLAYNLFKKAKPILVDEFALDPELLSHTIASVNGVLQVNRVRSRWIGSDKVIDIIIAVDRELSTDESHKIATEIESLIEDKFGVLDASIHVEPFGL